METITLFDIRNNLTISQWEHLYRELHNFDDHQLFYEGVNAANQVVYYTEFNTPRWGNRYWKHIVGKRGKISLNSYPADTLVDSINKCKLLIKSN